MASKSNLMMLNLRLNKPINHIYWKTNVQHEYAALSGSSMTDDECFSPNSNLENTLRMCLCKSLAELYLH